MLLSAFGSVVPAEPGCSLKVYRSKGVDFRTFAECFALFHWRVCEEVCECCGRCDLDITIKPAFVGAMLVFGSVGVYNCNWTSADQAYSVRASQPFATGMVRIPLLMSEHLCQVRLAHVDLPNSMLSMLNTLYKSLGFNPGNAWPAVEWCS